MNWTDFLTNIGIFTVGSITITGILAFLAKHVFDHYLQRKLDQHQANLERQSDEHRHRLELIAQEHQIRFSRLHSDRAEVIVTLFKKLVTMDHSMRAYIGPVIGVAPEKEIRDERAGTAAQDFFEYFSDNEIFFEDSLCETINEMNKLYLDAWHSYNIYDDEGSRQTAQFDRAFRKERTEVFKKAWQTIDEQIPKVRAKLKDELRKLLGVI